MGRLILVVLTIVVVLAGWSAVFTVDQAQYAVVTRFGDPVDVITEPGLRWKYPAPIDRVMYFDKRLLVLDQPAPGDPPREFLTLDKKNIEVSTYTCWRINEPQKFLENVGDRDIAEAALGDIIQAELGKVLGEQNLSALLSTDPEERKFGAVTEEILATCAAQADREYGIEIVDFRIKRLTFPEQNRTSVFERMRAERKRIATRYRSEGAAEATKIKAEAEKQRSEIQSKASRKAREIEGKAEAKATEIYGQAYGQDVEFFQFLRTLASYKASLTNTTVYMSADHPYLKLLRDGPKAPTLPEISDDLAQTE